MSKKILAVILLVVFVGGSFFMFFGTNKTGNAIVDHSGLNFETKVSESTVTIDLTPKEFYGNNFYIDIGVNTHTVDLSQFDLKQLVTLEIKGKTINPLSAPELKGHHNSGTLIFEIEDEPREFIIRVVEFPDFPVRTFNW